RLGVFKFLFQNNISTFYFCRPPPMAANDKINLVVRRHWRYRNLLPNNGCRSVRSCTECGYARRVSKLSTNPTG
ncbi:MAG: hypothetical protein OXJ53_15635, partial [Gammaproteobacteria bacterium]|nr:hypothetical protein [Gammaproteobacteria bacterium]